MSLDYFPIKLGDRDPRFEVILGGSDGAISLATVTDVRVAYRRDPGAAPILERDATFNTSGQTEGHADRGRIWHDWEEGDTELLFGEPGADGQPGDVTTAVVHLHAEVELVRDGRRITWPTEDYIDVRVWRDIVVDAS